MSDEKTEEPTEKKLEDAKKKGQSPKSQDVNAAAAVFGMTLVVLGLGPSIWLGMSEGLGLALQDWRNLDDARLHTSGLAMLRHLLGIVLPALAASVVLGLVAGAAQVGIRISFEPLELKFDKINPADGIKKLISMKSLIEFAKMVLKAVALTAVVWSIVRGLVPLLVGAAYLEPVAIGKIAWEALLKLFFAASIVFVVVGPVDFGLQIWLFHRDQRMTKDEIKREHKDSEGDPMIKGQRRQLAQEMANSDPKKRVPNASVVVTNPTHFAVALHFVPGRAALPIVVAKGADEKAAEIREIAARHRIPVVGNPPLARALYKVRLDDPVPEELFEAVAAVLRWVGLVRAAATPPQDT